MSRKPLIAGNWKLHKTLGEARALATELKHALQHERDVDVSIAPPYTALSVVAEQVSGTSIRVAGQDLYFAESGAYTGAISAPLLVDAGCTQVLVGHSERRQLFGETLETSNKRTRAAIAAGLTPIICIGESLEEHQAKRAEEVVAKQFDAATQGLSKKDVVGIVVAYEPVWAIGTGQVATTQQAQTIHAFIRQRLAHLAPDAADSVRILYGGSVKPDNAQDLLAQPDIDGALVGGASLSAADFTAIVRARPGA